MASGFVKRVIPVFSGVAAFVVATVLLTAVYFVLGVLTGIYGMCSTAPDWWARVYESMLFVLPVAGLAAGVGVGLWVARGSREVSGRWVHTPPGRI